MNRVTRHWHTLLLVALAALGMVLVLLRNHPYGPGLHWDAVNFIGTARNLLAGEGWRQFNGPLYTVFAPLYPALLALSGLLSGFDPRALAGPLNALLFGLTVLAFGHWLRECIKSRWLALWGGLALACSLPLTAIFATAMSEPLFIFFVTLALFSMDRFRRCAQAAALIGAALFTALACLTRYAGIAFLMTLLLFLLLQPGRRLREKIKHGIIFLLPAGLPLGLWLLYNTARVGGPFGNRLEHWPPRFTLAEFVDASFSTLGRWILPDLPLGLDVALELAVALAAVMLFALAIAVGAVFIRAYQQPKWWPRWSSFCLCGGFALVYLTVMAILNKFTRYDIGGWHSRYWTPLYIPLLFALVFALDRWLMRLRRRGGTILLAALLFIWLGGIAELNRRAIVRANQGEHKYYAASHVVNNETLRFIRQQASGKFFFNVAYYSSHPVLYLYAEHALSDFSYLPRDLASLYETVAAADEGDWLVWFYPHNQYSYGPAELEAMPELERMAQLDDGIIFQIKRGF